MQVHAWFVHLEGHWLTLVTHDIEATQATTWLGATSGSAPGRGIQPDMDQARHDPEAAATGNRSDGESLAAPSPEGPRGVPEGASQNRSGLGEETAPLSPGRQDGLRTTTPAAAAPQNC